jgi:AAA+ ATPase superfamily predicted ATPase
MRQKMIFGREAEKAVLERLYLSKRAEFLAVYGRRRIGKTFLIYEFYQNKGVYFEVTGIKKASKKTQLRRFHKKFSKQFPQEKLQVPLNWEDAFDLINDVIERQNPSEKFILFLDELPWLASPKSGFLEALDYAWNHDFSRHSNVLLIICGSAASWIISKVVKDKGGLHGRLSAKIRLQPFTLSETEGFLASEGIHLKRKQLIELFMAVGGVAKYLVNILPGKSAVQIIDELCFSQQGFLFTEFTELYESLFNESEKHICIVRALSKRRKGLFLDELLEETQLQQGGRITEILEELEESGFIMQMPSFGKAVKNRKIRLIDEYTYFYLTWIEKIKSTLLRSSDMHPWNKLSRTPAYHEWAGHAFENICLKHTDRIKNALGIAGVATEESHWHYSASKKDPGRGAEIDLLIDRADDCINICEIKFCNSEFVIDRHYAEQLERKKAVFQRITKTKKTIFLTLITPFGVVKNEHYIGLVDQQLTMDALF